ncbi:hypothetical protein OH76DRAFT_1402198 [Lentinus brumalis]|uniref:Uncharacterized protein n=1 Tax=Lentinus brumalis TaxID=2498619 RepID=A0A371DDG9_9APHY|nr:hypothetical protein OH76DRAFT_1402198 [Polyporus brumalis]
MDYTENISPFTNDADSPQGPRRRRGSLPHSSAQPMTDSDVRPFSAVEGDIEDVIPLVGKGPGKGKAKGQGRPKRRTLEVIFGSLNLLKRSKTSKATSPPAEMDVSAVPADVPAQDPFGDENAMECDAGFQSFDWHGFGAATSEDAKMALGSASGEGAGGGSTSGVSTSRAVGFPSTPPKRRRSSIPTTPRSSPRSVKSRCSAMSWLTTSSEGSPASSLASIRTKYRRRHARRSAAKSVQVLGMEAAGLVARRYNVSENRMRWDMFRVT